MRIAESVSAVLESQKPAKSLALQMKERTWGRSFQRESTSGHQKENTHGKSTTECNV
jgi:hypothetical protein